nr:glycosyltransferase [Motilibacter aurantiacus]
MVLVAPLPPAPDGIADYAARLGRAYAEEGVEVAALTPTARPGRDVPVLGQVGWSPRRWLAAYRSARSWRPDAVHVQHSVATYGPGLLPLWLLTAALRRHGADVVVTHHEVTRDLARLGRPGRAYYRLVARATDRTHVHTAAAAATAHGQVGIPADRVLVHPHPVYPLPAGSVSGRELRERHALGSSRVLLLFGYVHVEKGLRELVEGLAVLRDRDPAAVSGLRLVVAGDVRPRPPAFGRFEQADRDYLDAVRARVDELGLGAAVRFVGRVPDPEVAGWFAAADLVVLPYTATEQSGVAGLALAAGRPVLATSVGGLGEVFSGVLPTFASLAPADVADGVIDGLQAASGSGWQERYAEIVDAASPRRLVQQVLATLDRPAERTGATT